MGVICSTFYFRQRENLNFVLPGSPELRKVPTEEPVAG